MDNYGKDKIVRPGMNPASVKQVFAQGGRVPFQNKRYETGGPVRVVNGFLGELGERFVSKGKVVATMGPEQPVTETIVTDIERLVGLEIRAELLKVVQEVGPRVLARVRCCTSCGKLFLAKKNGHRAKRCESCR